MKKISIPGGFVIPARVIKEDDETMTLQLAKDDSYKFKLSKDSKKNQFHTVVFVRKIDGQTAFWKPWEGE